MILYNTIEFHDVILEHSPGEPWVSPGALNKSAGVVFHAEFEFELKTRHDQNDQKHRFCNF